jgi:hypothetical protein
VLQAHGATSVPATQQFDTSSPTGMLMLNIPLSFAQLERELTRERTMSEMLGRAEKGLRHGGHVPLGFAYDKAARQLRAADDEGEGSPAILQACIEAANRSAVASVTDLKAAQQRHRDEIGRLTTSIRRLIEVMKGEGLRSEDLRDEYTTGWWRRRRSCRSWPRSSRRRSTANASACLTRRPSAAAWKTSRA